MLIRLANCELDTIIDDDDFDLVRGYKWHVSGKAPHLYVIAYHDNTYTLRHRLISCAGIGEKVDHKNHNTLDNRRTNIRRCAHSENMANRKMSKANKLGVKGVYFDKRGHKSPFRAEVMSNGIRVRSCHQSLDDAAKWVLEMSKTLHGEFVCFDGLPVPTAKLSG